MKITKVDRSDNERNTFYLMEDGRVISQHQALEMAHLGLIEDVQVGQDKDGHDYLRDAPDGRPSNNLQNLEHFNAAPDSEGYASHREKIGTQHEGRSGNAGKDSGPKGR